MLPELKEIIRYHYDVSRCVDTMEYNINKSLRTLIIQNKNDIDGLFGSRVEAQRAIAALEQTLTGLEERMARQADIEDRLSVDVDCFSSLAKKTNKPLRG